MSTKEPLIPSVLYTQGDTNVQRDEENDLNVPDPTQEAAAAAIEQATTCTSTGGSCESPGTNKARG